jgi:hypothetical protein
MSDITTTPSNRTNRTIAATVLAAAALAASLLAGVAVYDANNDNDSTTSVNSEPAPAMSDRDCRIPESRMPC